MYLLRRFSTAPKPKVLILAGPTGSGKTALSLPLAMKLNGEIISADSVQVVQGLDIGSDKIRVRQRKNIPHHMIDVVPFDVNFNANLYYDMAMEICNDIISRGKTPIFVGACAFYLSWILYGRPVTSVNVYSNQEFRKKIDAEMYNFSKSLDNSLTPIEMWDKLLNYLVVTYSLSESANELLRKLNRNDLQRLIRLMEILTNAGSNSPDIDVTDDFKKQKTVTPLISECLNLKFDFRCFYLNPPKIWSMRRVDARVEEFIMLGLIDEVKELMKRGFCRKHKASDSMGYYQTIDYLSGNDFSDESFINYLSRTMSATRRLVRTQNSFFPKNQIFEILPLDLPLLPVQAPVFSKVLEIPPLVQRNTLSRIIENFNYSYDDYWHGYRLNPKFIAYQEKLCDLMSTEVPVLENKLYISQFTQYSKFNNIISEKSRPISHDMLQDPRFKRTIPSFGF